MCRRGSENAVSFDTRDLHRRLDVFARDDVYLGTIVKIVAADRPAMRPDASGEQEAPAARHPSRVSGELLGPMPTASLGNPGPLSQSAAGGYRTEPDGARSLVGGSIVVGRWWGLVGRRTIRLDQILSLSLERVILKQTYEEIRADRPGASSGSGGR